MIIGPSDAWSLRRSTQQPSILYWRLWDLWLLCYISQWPKTKFETNLFIILWFMWEVARLFCNLKRGGTAGSLLLIESQLDKKSKQPNWSICIWFLVTDRRHDAGINCKFWIFVCGFLWVSSCQRFAFIQILR